MKIKYGCRDHRELLTESLLTLKYLSENEFKERLKKFNYKYYAFDDRVNQILFAIEDKTKNIKEPFWLFIEIIN